MAKLRYYELLGRVPRDDPRRPRGPTEPPRRPDEDGPYDSDELEAEFGSDGDSCLHCFYVLCPCVNEAFRNCRRFGS